MPESSACDVNNEVASWYKYVCMCVCLSLSLSLSLYIYIYIYIGDVDAKEAVHLNRLIVNDIESLSLPTSLFPARLTLFFT